MSSLQVSGLGLSGTNFHHDPSIAPHFTHAYVFLKISPRIYFSHDDIFKTFYIKPSLWRQRFEIHVDDHVFRSTDRSVPLVLLIEESGEVIKVDSFEKTFGISPDFFLQQPSILVRRDRTD